MTAPPFDRVAGGDDAGARGGRPSPRVDHASGTRERWAMRPEARALTFVALVLVAFGLVVVFSASGYDALANARPADHYFRRQLLGVALGTVAFAFAAKFDAEHWKRAAWPAMLVALVLMLVTVLPFTKGLSTEIGGSRRFLWNGRLQPAEFAKFAVILWTPMLLLKKGPQLRRLGKGLGPFLVVVGSLAVIAMLQPDVSMAITYLLLMAVLLFVGGARIGHFVFLALLTVPVAVLLKDNYGYVVDRIVALFSGGSIAELPRDLTQQDQALIAVGAGGLFGVGFGEGMQQRGWVPLAYNDFIAAVIGEEFGFLGIAAVTLAFAGYGWLGFRIARQARTAYQALVAVGLTFVTAFTAFVHLAVVIKLLPNTGLTLPFISYGSSNLALTLLMTGVLVNIGSERERVYGTGATDPLARGDG